MDALGYGHMGRNPWSAFGVDDYSDADLRLMCQWGVRAVRSYAGQHDGKTLQFNVFNRHEALVVDAYMVAHAPELEYLLTRVV